MREQTSLEDRLGSLAKIGANSTKRRRSLNSAKPRATREPRPAQFDQSFPVALAWGAHGPQHAVGLERNDRMSAPTPPIWDHAPRRSRARCLSKSWSRRSTNTGGCSPARRLAKRRGHRLPAPPPTTPTHRSAWPICFPPTPHKMCFSPNAAQIVLVQEISTLVCAAGSSKASNSIARPSMVAAHSPDSPARLTLSTKQVAASKAAAWVKD